MRKKYAKSRIRTVRESEPFDKRKIDRSKFKPDRSSKNLKKFFEAPGGVTISTELFPPIETLSVTKTVGLGRTNLTFIRPTIVQIDAATPRASFDLRLTPSRNPLMQMHFEPIAYGITSTATYIMEFTIEVFGQSTFNLAGFAGTSGEVLNDGTKVLRGKKIVSLILKNVPPAQPTFGILEQTAGERWNWFSTKVRFPPLVLTP